MFSSVIFWTPIDFAMLSFCENRSQVRKPLQDGGKWNYENARTLQFLIETDRKIIVLEKKKSKQFSTHTPGMQHVRICWKSDAMHPFELSFFSPARPTPSTRQDSYFRAIQKHVQLPEKKKKNPLPR